MMNGTRWMVTLQVISVVAAVLLAYATMSARLAVAESQIETLPTRSRQLARVHSDDGRTAA